MPGHGFNRLARSSSPPPAVRELLVWTESDDGLTGSESTQNREVVAIGRGFGHRLQTCGGL